MEQKTKCILSLNVARRLIDAGLKVVGIEHSKKTPGNLAFLFEDTDELNSLLASYQRPRR